MHSVAPIRSWYCPLGQAWQRCACADRFDGGLTALNFPGEHCMHDARLARLEPLTDLAAPDADAVLRKVEAEQGRLARELSVLAR